MKTPSVVLLLLGFAISTADAQVLQEWVARYASATPYSDVPYAMTLDAAGNILVTGTTGTSTGGNDWATIKYNSAGVQQWLRTQDGGGNDAAFAITTDAAGNVYVTGSSAGGLYFMTAKYSSAGAQLWVQFFTTIGEGDAGVDIALDHEGNVYVTGYNVETATGLDIITIKYSPGGVELWVRRFDSANGEDVPAAIACDASGIYVTGRSGSSFTTLKYDFNGVQQWVRHYNGGHGSDAAAGLIADAAGNIYVTGQSTGDGTNHDYATIKYDAAGTELWVRRYDGPTIEFARDYDRAAALALDADGNVFVTGNSSDDFATVKYDAAGTEIWVRRHNGPGAGGDWATSIAVDASGNSYVTGSSFGNSTTQYDFASLSYDASGTVRWTEHYNGPANDYDTPYSIAVDSSGNVYVSGSSGGVGTGQDYTTIKYAPATASVAPQPLAPRSGFALQSDPNPFTRASRIRFTIPGTNREHVRLAVYDVSGREVALLVNEALSPGTHERELNGSTLAAGVYWSRLEAGGLSEIRKLIHVR
jgi:Beta-propeller repeat/Secretion system C-terminal sorting domain